MLTKIIICLIPFNIECCLTRTTRNGNMALNGIYLNIYNKRNLFYISLPLLYLSYIYNYTMYGLLLSLICFGMFFNACYTWHYVLFSV